MALRFVCAVLSVALLASCATKDAAVPVEEQPELSGVSAWIVYWDLAGADGALFIPDELTDFCPRLGEEYPDKNWEYYLTVVNDVGRGADASLKDTAILAKLFRDESSMGTHVEELITLAVRYGFHGIDVDYEAIGSDLELWGKYLEFLTILQERADEKNISIRVILEPNTPFDKLAFPSGLEYVTMCYNLFGWNETPGPKADDAFLRETLNKTESLPGKRSFALASGGYDWPGGKRPSQITEAAAAALAAEHGATLYRSKDSGALSFQYQDSQGTVHTVWYADTLTLRRWEEIVSEDGKNSVMLWRIEPR